MRSSKASAAAFALTAGIGVAAVPAQAAADGPVTVTASGYHNGPVRIDVTESGDNYILNDLTRPGTRCGAADGRPLSVPKDSLPGPVNETFAACVDIMYGAQRQWDMLRDWLGRNGPQGNGRNAPAVYDPSGRGPIWGGYVVFTTMPTGGRAPATTLDLVGHQFGHVIYQSTPGGTGSGNESGGLFEGAADIFGVLTDHYADHPRNRPNYLIGDSPSLMGDRPLRNMYNPSLLGDPNCYSTAIPSTEVHAAAGPLNHWFYLLAEGANPGGGKPSSPVCAGEPTAVTGIGIRQAGRIVMNALLRKTSQWNYAKMRVASVSAAIDLFGPGSPECPATKAAWRAVNVHPQPGEPSCADPSPAP
ncbi:M4 family metallopeptidase [Spongiactinospora rosea]|uniref:M4 family metallopeptidase n=1 Tax=Spongiactinospora rosea TaxID=2248750 RepID=UPI0013149E06|nr:M4 family metallopeptidase [Spongiactinospora rosea]